MALVLTSEMVSQVVIISIFRRSLRKLKWKFPSHAERWWTNKASMAMRKSSCKNIPQYLRSCCSPIGQNNTKDFSAQSGGSIGRAVWKWSGKSRFPGALSALLVNLRRFISLPDLFPFAPVNRPWVSEDGPREFVKKPLQNLKSTLWRAAIHKILLTTHSQKWGLNKGHKPSSNETKQKKRILPFITQYHPAVPNLKEILTMKWYLITATTIALSNLWGTAHNIIQKAALNWRYTGKSKNISKTRKPKHVFRSRVGLSAHINTFDKFSCEWL